MPTTSQSQLTEQIVVRFTPEQRAEMERVARRDHRRPAEWMRLQVLLALEESRESVVITRGDRA